MRENGIEESIDRPLTIALVVDTVGNQGNGTSNSALPVSYTHLTLPTKRIV